MALLTLYLTATETHMSYMGCADSLPVADDKCPMEPPEHTRFCEALCARDCVVSEWSQWTQCLPDLCRPEPAATSKQGTYQGRRQVKQSGVDSMGECGKGCPFLSRGIGSGIQSKAYQYAPQRLNPRNTLGKKWGGRVYPSLPRGNAPDTYRLVFVQRTLELCIALIVLGKHASRM